MTRQILNDRSVHVTVFDSENNLIQIIFQAYALNDVDDHYEFQVIKINIIQLIEKHLNVTYST